MLKSNNRQKGFSLIKFIVKLAVIVVLVAVLVPKFVQSNAYFRNQEIVKDIKNMVSAINTDKVADNGNLVKSYADTGAADKVPIYKKAIDYFPNYVTSYNVNIIVSAINNYKTSNNGKLPQSDADLDSYLSKSIASLGPSGAIYNLTYFPSVVIVTGTSPSSAIYSSEVKAGEDY